MSAALRRPAPSDAAPRSGASPRPNRPLRLGLGLLGVLLLLALLGPALAPHDPAENVRILRDPFGQWHTAPFAPLLIPGYPLGTDYDGRDILSRLLYAVRPTLLMAVLAGLARTGIGLGIGLLAGWARGRAERLWDGLIQGAAAMPILIVAILLLYAAGDGRDTATFALALSATGWASTALLVRAQVRIIREARYVEAARALGAGGGGILRRHVLPQLATLMPIRLALETGATLLVLAELGFLGFYLGGGEVRAVARGDTAGAWSVIIAGQPELAQLLSGGWQNFFQTPWLALWGGAAFFLAVLAFMALGEGLRRRAARRFG